MNRVPVVSSNVAEIGYDVVTNSLEVLFRNGAVYQYFNVPYAVYEGLLSASSVGRYFDVNVKKAGYAVRKVAG